MAEVFYALISNDLYGLHEALVDVTSDDLNQPVIGSLSALHVAAEKGYSSCVKALLSAGCNINIQDEQGLTPLMTSIVAGFPLTAINFIHAGCDCNIHDNSGMTALHYASQHGSAGVVQLLLASGAKPNVLNHLGQSPLNCALRKLHGEVVKALLYGSSYVDIYMASSPDFPQPLYKSLCENCFTVGVTLLMAGYNGVVELHKYWRQFKVGRKPRNLSLNEVYNFNYLTSPEFSVPASLQHVCRLKIREILNDDIPMKLLSINYPALLKDFICYKEVYHAAKLDSLKEIFAYFNDNSQEMSDLS